MNDEEIIKKSKEEAKILKKTIARQWTSIDIYPREDEPVSVFMAGSPGAGKTESAKRIIELRGGGTPILHLDPDEIRKEFDDYTGDNAQLFQAAVSDVLNRMHDYALKNSQSFILDGTLSSFDPATKNIDRSLKEERKRSVYIIYVYQDPVQAWNFVQARKNQEGRKIPKDAFIAQYFAARSTVNKLIEKYEDKVVFELIVKNIEGRDQEYQKGFRSIDDYVPERYSEKELQDIL